MLRLQKILISASYTWPVYAPAFSKALQDLGVCVSALPFESVTKSRISRFEFRFAFGPSIILFNSMLRKKVKFERPDISFVWTGFGVWPSTIRYINQFTWSSSYTNDDPFGPRGKASFWHNFKKSIPAYDSHHVYRNINIDEYHSLGAKKVGILRSYYVPWLHYVEDNHEYESSVTFIGHGEPYRFEVINYLAQNGIPVNIFGPGKTWEAMPRVENVKIHPVSLPPDQYRQIIGHSALCIGFLSRLNRDDYTRRYFEIPACGGVLLAERTAMGLSLYREDEEAMFFDTKEELLEKCKTLLVDTKLRNHIRAGGLSRCSNSGYDVRSRASQWLLDLEEFMFQGERL